MFEELSTCLGAHRTLSEEETGRVVDQLRKIAYFSELNSAFGADYLVLMVPLLEAYVLRAGLELLGEGNQHLLL